MISKEIIIELATLSLLFQVACSGTCYQEPVKIPKSANILLLTVNFWQFNKIKGRTTHMNLGSCVGINKRFHCFPEQLKTRTSVNDKHSAKCLHNLLF